MNKNDDIVLVTAFTPTTQKLDDLRQLIIKIKSFGYRVCLATHSKTPQDIIDRCDYFIYDKENEINYDIDIRHWRFYTTTNFIVTYKPHNIMATHIVPITRLIIGGLSYLKSLGAKKVYLLEYDTIIETDEVLKNISSYLDESTITGFFDESGGHQTGKYLFGPLMGLNVDRINLSDFPVDSKTLVSLFREYFNRKENLPVTERIFFDLLWSKYDIKWNKFELAKNGLSLNMSQHIIKNDSKYIDTTYCFFLRNGNVNFFVGNDSGLDYKIDLIVNESCSSMSVINNGWYTRDLGYLENIKNIKVIINNRFIEEIDMGLQDSIERITKWAMFQEKKSEETIERSEFQINFDMVPVVEIKNTTSKSKVVEFVGVNEKEMEFPVFVTELSNGNWAKPNDMYFKNWKVYIDGELKYKTDVSFESVCAIVSTYPDSEDVKNKTIDTIKNIQDNIKIPVICATHIDYISNPNQLIDQSNHYVMNPTNTLTHQSYYRYFTGNLDGYKIFVDLWKAKNQMYHGPAVHQNYYNGVKLAKEKGYKYAILTNFDMNFSLEEIEKIKCILNTTLINESSAFFLYANMPEGPTYRTVFCIVDVDLFLNTFDEIKNENDYSHLVSKLNSESNGLENIYYHAFKNVDKVITKEIVEWEFFTSKKCLTNFQFNLYTIIPIKSHEESEEVIDYSILVRKSNSEVISSLKIVVRDIESSEMIYSEQFEIDGIFEKIIPIQLEDYKKYEFTFTDVENSKVIKETVYELDNISSTKQYGYAIPM